MHLEYIWGNNKSVNLSKFSFALYIDKYLNVIVVKIEFV